MKKKIVMMILAATLCGSLLCACGDDKKTESAAPETKTEETAKAEETPAKEEAASGNEEVVEIEETDGEDSESEGTFSLLDVDESMVDVGAYGMDEEGTELVFTMFTGPDGNNYVSLFGFDNNSDKGDVICGQYEASTEKDEDGLEWTYFDVEDVYTGNHFKLGVCEKPETDEIYFFDEEANVIPGKFLTESETIQYMGSAAGLIDN